MTASTTNKRVQFLEKAVHFITAFVILLKGLDKIDNPEKTAYAMTFIVIALLIILGTIFHHRFERVLKHFKAYTWMFEAVVMALVGYLYAKEGKQFIQYVCFAASIMFIVATLVYIRKQRSDRSKTLSH